jgi:hypothetical protein
VSRQAGTGKANVSEPPLKRRESETASEPGSQCRSRDEPGGYPSTGQAVPGVQVARAWSAACVRNHGKARADTAPARKRARGSAPSGRNREALSTVAARAGGPARSSGEVPVMGAERRGRLICGLLARRWSPGGKPGLSPDLMGSGRAAAATTR